MDVEEIDHNHFHLSILLFSNVITARYLRNASKKKRKRSEKEMEDTMPAFLFIGATAPIWALAYLHETLLFTSVY
jgi:hypothetical protein